MIHHSGDVPNDLAFCPGGRTLYVNENGSTAEPPTIRAPDVRPVPADRRVIGAQPARDGHGLRHPCPHDHFPGGGLPSLLLSPFSFSLPPRRDDPEQLPDRTAVRLPSLSLESVDPP